MLVLGFNPLEVFRLILGPLELPRETFKLTSQLSLGPVQLLLQIEDFLTIGVPFPLIKLLELLHVFP